ncbi:hypothetical protein PsalMR5_04218 (plasmid) [Piscirickettsia salmonis]|uniref:hypothetical protein n=1 Tax=Piscirickettsia salmonis TaxID=1238 RepID=UPI0012BAF64C|nr:hypothetical protein [Piscirickettsia salmonis]QGP56727.1 hypothetical protein PsalSR1_04216 [Piscirickettsia salmonis]QGP61655.1 hypothetical protein PsalBI1_04297 [Piscirickettsia salmonis]QGP66293.1 hypothetical protein PsalMR5_04218 [Piscirickettsia salmonis]
MKQKKQSKSYPKEFKEEAVALVTEQGYSVQKAGLLQKIRISFRKVVYLHSLLQIKQLIQITY